MYYKYLIKITICAHAVLFASAGCQSTNIQSDTEALGVTYHLRQLNDPRPNRVHILRVDLSQGKIRPVVVLAEDPDGSGPAEAALTNPLKLAKVIPAILIFSSANNDPTAPTIPGLSLLLINNIFP